MSLLGLRRHGAGPLFVWLHGFTQTKDSAHQFRSILAGTHEVLTLDLPGHGENASIPASLEDSATMLEEVLPKDRFVLGGYSFGARIALHFALRYPERLDALVLVGATRGIYDEDDRLVRRHSDEALATRIEAIGAAAFLDEWLSREMFASLPPDPLERAARSTDSTGLAAALRLAGTGTQRWLVPELATLTVPTLAIAGALDQKFCVEATALAEVVVDGRVAVVPRANHAVHLEQPVETARAVVDFTRPL